MGEIDFIVSGHLTDNPFVERTIEGVAVQLETVAEVIAKKVYHRGSEVQARDLFDIAAAAQDHRAEIVAALSKFPDRVAKTIERVKQLKPEFIEANIGQLMISPAYRSLVPGSYDMVVALLEEAMGPSSTPTCP
jgi:hypothetical protein